MSAEYSRAILRVSIAQWCQGLGWQSVHASVLELMTDVLERYILQMSTNIHNYAEQCKYS